MTRLQFKGGGSIFVHFKGRLWGVKKALEWLYIVPKASTQSSGVVEYNPFQLAKKVGPLGSRFYFFFIFLGESGGVGKFSPCLPLLFFLVSCLNDFLCIKG